MLTRDPRARASAEDLLKHEWITKNKDEIHVDRDQLTDVILNI